MTAQTAAILLAAAIAFLIPLSGYALHLHLEAKRMANQAKETHERERKKARSNLLENLEILARAIEDEQMNPTEGCLRVRVLLDLLDEGGHVLREDLVIFDQIHQKAKHLATHQAREDLPREEKEKQDQERRALEEQFEAQIKQGATALRSFCEDQGIKPSNPLFVNAAAKGS